MTFLISLTLALSLPAVIGLTFLFFGPDKARTSFGSTLVGIASLLALVWLIILVTSFFGFAISGGNPTFVSLGFSALLVSSPFLIGSILSIVSGYLLR
ncbi:MAG: hypothetical protein RIE78_09470, partial [Roseitalea porphyridii]